LPPEFQERAWAERRVALDWNGLFLSVLRRIDPGLSSMFESDLAKKALMFNEVYNNAQVKELYDLAFGKSSDVEERKSYVETLFKQNLDELLKAEGIAVKASF
jgi:hypothetical protein